MPDGGEVVTEEITVGTPVDIGNSLHDVEAFVACSVEGFYMLGPGEARTIQSQAEDGVWPVSLLE